MNANNTDTIPSGFPTTASNPAPGAESSPEPLPHLGPRARRLLNAPLEERLRAVAEDKWVLHNGAKRILRILKQTLAQPLSERPRDFAVIGPTNTGKTATLNCFYRDLGGDPADRVGSSERTPILLVELTGRSTEPRTLLAMARSLRLPVVNERQSREVSDLILRKVKERRVRMVVFLELDHIGPIGKQERSVVFHMMKNITNEGISIVAAGTERCIEYLKEDEQIDSRLRPLYLQGFANNDEYRDFLATLETFYPLPQPSFLWRDYADAIFKKTSGVTGEIVYLLNEAAAWTLREGRTCIDDEALGKCDYIEAISPAQLGKK